MPRSSRLGVALALSLSLVALCPNPTAAQDTEPKIIAVADGEAEPLTFSWVDKADGTLSTDSQLATVRQEE